MVERPGLDASTYQPELQKICLRLIHYLHRGVQLKTRGEHTAAYALMVTLQLALSYWRTATFFGYLDQNPCAGWHDEHLLVLPLIDRNLLDSLFNVIFISEDFVPRGIVFAKAGWREEMIALQEMRKDFYGVDRDEEWLAYLAKREAALEKGKPLSEITAAEASDPWKIASWIKPHNMIRYKLPDKTPYEELPHKRKLLQFLYERFYKGELSSIAHANAQAQYAQGFLAAGMTQSSQVRDELRPVFDIARSKSTFRSSAFLLAIACEAQQMLGLTDDLIEVRLLLIWEKLCLQGEIKDIYDLGYKERFHIVSFDPGRLNGQPFQDER